MRSMRHNPVCFTGHGRGSTLTISCLHPFLFFGELPRRPQAVGAPRRVFGSITNVTARCAWASLIVASSVFRSSAGTGLCRITRARNSSGRCHGAGIRHNPGCGITTQVVGSQILVERPPICSCMIHYSMSCPCPIRANLLRDGSGTFSAPSKMVRSNQQWSSALDLSESLVIR
jgi:hypothetical protein